MKRLHIALKGLVLLAFVIGLAGCDFFEDINPFDNEKETHGVIETIGDNFLMVDGIEYRVTEQTKFEGIDGLGDLSVGDEVEIEYKKKSGGREAVEIELKEAHGEDGEMLSLALCAPDEHGFTLDIDNAFFPLPVGRQWSYEGEEEGTSVELHITVFDETEEIAGVTTRVVEEREWEDDELIEVSRNFFAQTEEGTVCYFGEAVDIYEEGEVVSHEGSWRADESGNAPGIFMPDDPEVGMRFKQELAPGVAEDVSEIVARGEQVTVPYGTFEETLRVVDWNPLEGQTMSDGDEKVYAEDVGLIVDGPVELVAVNE